MRQTPCKKPRRMLLRKKSLKSRFNHAEKQAKQRQSPPRPTQTNPSQSNLIKQIRLFQEKRPNQSPAPSPTPTPSPWRASQNEVPKSAPRYTFHPKSYAEDGWPLRRRTALVFCGAPPHPTSKGSSNLKAEAAKNVGSRPGQWPDVREHSGIPAKNVGSRPGQWPDVRERSGIP